MCIACCMPSVFAFRFMYMLYVTDMYIIGLKGTFKYIRLIVVREEFGTFGGILGCSHLCQVEIEKDKGEDGGGVRYLDILELS